MRKLKTLLIILLIPAVLTAAENIPESQVSSILSIKKILLICYQTNDSANQLGFVKKTDSSGVENIYSVVDPLKKVKRLKKKIKLLKSQLNNTSDSKEKKRLRSKKKRLGQTRKAIKNAISNCQDGKDISDGDINNPDNPDSSECGNGSINEGTEVCDDANDVNGDGCSDLCTIESGYQCSGEPSQCISTALTELSDEFNDTSSLANWSIFTDGPDAENYYEQLDINQSTSGYLTLVPGPGHSGWYGSGTGAMLSKLITGNFIAEVYLITRNKNNLSEPPTEDYNSAGIIARNPNTSLQNYVVTNLGMQSHENGVGSEGKTTVDSNSTLYLLPGANSGRLRMCRVGSTFRILRFLDGESGWTQTNDFNRNDLPETLQVGIMANGWVRLPSEPADDPPNLHAAFDYIRFYPVSLLSECDDAF